MKQDSKEPFLEEYSEVYNSIVESGQNPNNVLVSYLLRNNFPDVKFSNDSIFVNVTLNEDKSYCMRLMNSFECIIEDARERLNARCSGFIKNRLTCSFYGIVKMADGTNKYMNLAMSNIADIRCRVVGKCLVLLLLDSKDVTQGFKAEYTVIDSVSNEKIHATVEF